MNEAGASTTLELHGAAVLVLGLGDSGLGMAAWCARAGAGVRVWDSRDNAPQETALAQRVPGALRLRGALTPESLNGVSLLLKSPGLAPHDERIAPLLKLAAESGVPVQGELDLFIAALHRLDAERGYAPKLIAITGTNGKTTTTAMAALLIERAGRSVALAGNIGPTLLDTLARSLDALLPEREAAPPAADVAEASCGVDAADAANAASPPDAAALPDVWVLELSSFQLDGVKGFAPHAAAVLNLTEDHLDWHGDMATYTEAKANIFGPQTVRVLNRDDARVAALAPTPVLAPPPARGRAKAKPVRLPDMIWFGLDAPRRAGDFGLVVENDMAWLVRAQPVDDTPRRAGASADEDELILQRLMPADALHVRGRHNAANALAALALAGAIGCPLAPMLHGLREYRGEPHRVEHLGTIDGVDAFDDSKGTNVGATVAALNGLGADKAPAKLVVILGGDGKGQDFTPLREPVQRYVRAVATLGRDAERIETTMVGIGTRVQRHATLEAATRWCFTQAAPGDAVLLSPACASLDMFRNYVHRAEVFAAEVSAVASERGGVVA